MSVFGIRYSGIKEHYQQDQDKQRLKDELRILDSDITKSIKRALRAAESTEELQELLEFVEDKLDTLR